MAQVDQVIAFVIKGRNFCTDCVKPFVWLAITELEQGATQWESPNDLGEAHDHTVDLLPGDPDFCCDNCKKVIKKAPALV